MPAADFSEHSIGDCKAMLDMQEGFGDSNAGNNNKF